MHNNSCYSDKLLPLNDALNILDDSISPLSDYQQIDLRDALDRISYTEVFAEINIPAFDNSAMDGFALRYNDVTEGTPCTFTCVGTSLAGTPFLGQLTSGQCVRIMTGGEIPRGADTVIAQEDVQRDDKQIKLNQGVKIICGQHIRPTGNDVTQGTKILNRGKRLNPADLGMLASAGKTQVSVYRKIKVALFSTGNELKNPGETLNRSDIYESNRCVISAILSRFNLELFDLGIIPDSYEDITAALHAASHCDVVISTGGASVGDSDYTRQALQNLTEIKYYKLAIKPGKPFSFGKKNHRLFFGLPGNPVSATLTLHQLVLPALRKLSGEGFIRSLTFPAQVASPIKKRPGRIDFQRGIYQVGLSPINSLAVRPLSNQSSGVLSSLCHANCFIKIAAESGDVDVGEWVDIIPFDRWMV